MEATYLMSIPRPVEGGCDSSPDFRAELETNGGNGKGNGASGSPRGQSTDASASFGPLQNSEEAE